MSPSQTMNERIDSKNAPEPVGHYPHARRVGDLVFLSGVGPRERGSKKIPGVELDSEGKILSYDIEAQCHSVFRNVRAILEDAGSGWDQLVDVTVYLTNMKKDFPTYNRLWGDYFKDHPPCRTTLEIGSLPTPIAIELKCVATIRTADQAPRPQPETESAKTSQRLMPLHFMKWVNENRHKLKPPVGNQQIWEDREFMVTVIGGPNSRQDYHINEGEEFFYQIEGDMVLRILEAGKPRDVPIREGEILLLPGKVPHSPQRPAGTVGLVIERKRLPHEKDGLMWLCRECGKKLYEETFHLTNIVTQLPPVFDRFYGNPENTLCKNCGCRAERPAPPKV